MKPPVVVVLGASDYEMHAIQQLALSAMRMGMVTGVLQALNGQGTPVIGGEAYTVAWPVAVDVHSIWIECGPAPEGSVVIDHHRPGDPGFGRPPSEFWEASSLGQFVCFLEGQLEWACSDTPEDGRAGYLLESLLLGTQLPGISTDDLLLGGREKAAAEIMEELWYIAAADNCLAAASLGKCLGIDGTDLTFRRLAWEASARGVAGKTLTAEYMDAQDALIHAPLVEIGGVEVRDLRAHDPAPPGLRFAGPASGRPYICRVKERGRIKVVLGGDGEGTDSDGRAAAGFAAWAAGKGLVDAYGGDPARGFAGAYER